MIKTLDETRAAEDLARLDTLLAQQPQLKDGKRWCAHRERAAPPAAALRQSQPRARA